MAKLGQFCIHINPYWSTGALVSSCASKLSSASLHLWVKIRFHVQTIDEFCKTERQAPCPFPLMKEQLPPPPYPRYHLVEYLRLYIVVWCRADRWGGLPWTCLFRPSSALMPNLHLHFCMSCVSSLALTASVSFQTRPFHPFGLPLLLSTTTPLTLPPAVSSPHLFGLGTGAERKHD